MKQPTLLLVTYSFPPFGGASVRRVTKMVKYLSALGWRCIVLTSSRVLPNERDSAALDDVPPATIVIRTATLEPVATGPGHPRSLLALRRILNVPLVPSVGMLWAACALGPGLAACRRHRPDAVLCTGPDFSTHVLGALLNRLTGTPLIVDYRDEWTTHPERATRIAGRKSLQLKNTLDRSVEAATLARASHALVTTSGFVAPLEERFPFARRRISVLTNGYDRDELRSVPPPRRPRRRERVLVHLGSVFRREQYAPTFLRALRERAARRGETVILRMIGVIAPTLRARFESCAGPGLNIEVRPFVPARDAIQALAEADLLVLFLRTPGMGRYLNLKVFDYLAANRPILGLCPRESETARLIDACGVGTIIDVDAAEDPAPVIDAWLDGRHPFSPRPEHIAQYDWSILARRLDALLRGVKPDALASAPRVVRHTVE